MATLNWTQVQSWIQKNPYKTKCLKPYAPGNNTAEGVKDQTNESGWTKTQVSPATPLSAILIAQDVMYYSSSDMTRKSILRDETTDMQEKAVLHLKGRAWPVRRTSEGLVACGIEEGRASTWPSLGWNALCALREIQLVIYNEDKKIISFYPEDVRTWSSSIDILCIDYECRFIWNHASIKSILCDWITTYEKSGWTINWPLMEGTMDELKKLYASLENQPPTKLNKENLQKRIGAKQSIQLLSSWSKESN
jgi:hypothetical protein